MGRFDAAAPAAALAAFLPGALQASASQQDWQDGDDPLPAVYLSHGAPPLFDDQVWLDELLAWSLTMPKPTAIVIVSAHWEQAPATISSPHANAPLVYDFYGFHKRYYEVDYPTPDAGRLAERLRAVLSDSHHLHSDSSRGLDHGAWVPLKAMYPLGDVPVVQLSLPGAHAQQLLTLGSRLRELRSEGVLVVGSGFMTHGLSYLTREAVEGRSIPGWSADFDAWAAEALAAGDVDALTDFRRRAPGMPYAHPTVEHFTPLFVTLGAAADPTSPVSTAIDGYMMGLSKRSFQMA